MDGLPLLSLGARLLLAFVLLAAGAFKLAGRSKLRQSLADFGLPAPAAQLLALILPLGELLIAAALLVDRLAVFGGLAALLLLAAFTAAIGWQLARGRRPECPCFGDLAAGPIGWTTLLRNLGLLALALLASRPSDVGLAAALEGLAALEAPAAATLTVAIAVVLAQTLWIATLHRELRAQQRQLAEFADHLDARGLPPGTPVPAFTAPDAAGRLYGLRELLPVGQELLLVFHEPDCGPCRELLPRLREWQERLAGRCAIVVIGRGGPRLQRARSLEGLLALWQEENEISTLFRIRGLPTAVLVSAEGLVRSPPAIGAAGIATLLAGSFD